MAFASTHLDPSGTAPSRGPGTPRSLIEPSDIRGYFAQVSEVLSCAASAIAKARQSELHPTGELDFHLHYLGYLGNTTRALALKYGFAGFFSDRLPSNLEIMPRDSGWPTATEIRRLEVDMQAAMAQPAPKEDYRKEMLDHILTLCEPPRNLQFLHSQASYQRALRAGRLFTSVTDAQLLGEKAGQDHDAGSMSLLHWGTWDPVANCPVAYLLSFEEVPGTSVHSDVELLARLRGLCSRMSQVSLTLLTIASEIDEQFPSVRIKALRRIIMGPLMSSRFAELPQDMSRVLGHVSGDWKLDWIYRWTTEVIKSRGSRKSAGGFFRSERFHESFDIDLKDHRSVTSGATETVDRVLMPYEVFQGLPQGPDAPFMDTIKYVVDPDGNIISQA